MSFWNIGLNENYLYYLKNNINQGYQYEVLTKEFNKQITETEIIQCLNKDLEFDGAGNIINKHPSNLFSIYLRSESINSKFSRVKIEDTCYRTENQLNAKFISSPVYYSKELVLTLAILEAAHRSNYHPKLAKIF